MVKEYRHLLERLKDLSVNCNYQALLSHHTYFCWNICSEVIIISLCMCARLVRSISDKQMEGGEGG